MQRENCLATERLTSSPQVELSDRASARSPRSLNLPRSPLSQALFNKQAKCIDRAALCQPCDDWGMSLCNPPCVAGSGPSTSVNTLRNVKSVLDQDGTTRTDLTHSNTVCSKDIPSFRCLDGGDEEWCFKYRSKIYCSNNWKKEKKKKHSL